MKEKSMRYLISALVLRHKSIRQVFSLPSICSIRVLTGCFMAVLFAYIHVSFIREAETWFRLLFTRKISRRCWWIFVSMFLYNMYEKVYRSLDYRPLAWKWRSHDNLLWCGFGCDFLHSPQGREFTDFQEPFKFVKCKVKTGHNFIS